MDQMKDSAFWCQASREFFGSFLWIMIVAQSDGNMAYALGIVYVVLGCCFDGAHFFPAFTLYRMVADKMDMLKGLVWLLFQVGGAYAAGHFMTLMELEPDASKGFEISAWKTGLKEFIALMFVLQALHMTKVADWDGSMPAAFFQIFAFAIACWFMGDGCTFNFARQFANDSFSGFWVSGLWTVLAAIVTWAKFEYICKKD